VVQGKADAAASYGPAGKSLLQLAGLRGEIAKFDYADQGIVLPSHGVVASLKTIETRPDVVARFVAASAKGWIEARKNPGAAVEATVGSFPLLKGKEEVIRVTLEDYLNYVETPGTVGKPFGWQSAEDWRKAEAIMAQYMDLKPQGSVGVYFTNEFIRN
jgi:NitT/TauT family transport system substrate-binding protein